MRLFVSKIEAEWLLLATKQHKNALGDGSLKSKMGNAALEELEKKLTEQLEAQQPKEEK